MFAYINNKKASKLEQKIRIQYCARRAQLIVISGCAKNDFPPNFKYTYQ
jgi:hypothetical protein